MRQGQKLAMIAILIVFAVVVIVLIPRGDSPQIEGSAADSTPSVFDTPEQPEYKIYNDPTDLGNIREYYQENR